MSPAMITSPSLFQGLPCSHKIPEYKQTRWEGITSFLLGCGWRGYSLQLCLLSSCQRPLRNSILQFVGEIPWVLHATCLKRPCCKQGMVCAPTPSPQLAEGWDVATAFLLSASCSIGLCECCGQMQDLALGLGLTSWWLCGPSPQLCPHPFGWHLFPLNQVHHTQLGVICKLAEGALDPAVSEETGCYRLVTNSFGPSTDSWGPLTADLFPPIQPLPYRSNQSISNLARMLAGNVKDLPEVQVEYIHSSSLVH